MTEGRFGALGDASGAVRAFILERLEPAVIRTQAARVINIELEFTEFLAERGVDRLVATETSVDQRLLVRRKVQEQIERWTSQGVSAPAGFSMDNEGLLVTWRHGSYEQLTGLEPPPAGMFEIQEWLAGQTNRSFLLPCACYLASIGCDPIYVTDGSRDEGIDCIGMLRSGPLRSTALFVQAKSQSVLKGSELLQEFGKFSALPRTAKYLQYLEALGVPRSTDGTAFVYLLIVNGDFHYSAVQQARNAGALIRSRRQLAQQLSRHYDASRLEELKSGVELPSGADLVNNLGPILIP
jgi:hypothetical protein